MTTGNIMNSYGKKTVKPGFNPDEPVLTVFWQIWACFALVYLIVDGAFLAGALVAYAWYLFVHYCAHHGSDNLPLSLLKHHKSHHRFASRNYGVSTTLWDHVFEHELDMPSRPTHVR